jgi:hypothetical protein
MATALKTAFTAPVTAQDILANIQDMPCPYLTTFKVTNDRVPLPVPAVRNLDQDIKLMLAERGLSPRELEMVYQHAVATWLEVSGRTDADGMTAQLEIAVGMCDLYLAARKMR